MFVDTIVRRISALVGRHGPETAIPAETVDAHASIAATLAKGLPLAADPTGALGRLSVLAPPIAERPGADTARTLGFIRSRPITGAFDVLSAPAWAHGMAVARTTGPIFDEHGIPSWIDTIALAPKQIEIMRAPAGPAIAFVQTSSTSETTKQGVSVVTFGPGSIWLAAPLLAKTSPANGYAGIAFSSATLTVPGTLRPAPGGNVILLAHNVTAQLEILPVVAAPPAPGLRNDGSVALASLPPRVRFECAPNGTHAVTLENAALTAYGVTTLLGGGVKSVTYDADLSEIALWYDKPPTPAEFVVTSSAAPTFELRGRAGVRAAAYRIPVAQTTPDALGPAASGGALGLTLGAGLEGRWGNIADSAPFGPAVLHVQTGAIGIVAHTLRRRFTDTYALWNARPVNGQLRATSVTIDGPRDTVVRIMQSAQLEITFATGCRVDTHVDRPVLGNGAPASLAALVVTYGVGRTTAGDALVIEGVASPTTIGDFRPIEAYVIENAVLRTRGAEALFVHGKLQGNRAVRGVMVLGSSLDRVTPMLPDPYAAELALGRVAAPETLIAITSWTAPAAAQLAFAIQRQADGAASPLQGTIETVAAERAGGFSTLYDVSSAQNQFGVAVSGAALANGEILGQQLAVSGLQSALFTVPAVSWEPVLDPMRNWLVKGIAGDDGPPAIVNVPTAALRPLAPGVFLDAFLSDYAKGADLYAQLTLPFGLTATIDTNANLNTQPFVPRPELGRDEPVFADDRSGGKQLSIKAIEDVKAQRTVMPGRSRAGSSDYTVPPPPDPDPDSTYVHGILDDSPNSLMARFWNGDFGGDSAPATDPHGNPEPPNIPIQHFVPLSRYDLSGYGASIFSDYDYTGPLVGIDQARFDVIVGRTVYELVEAQSFILPWYIPVVNTTIFERDKTGYVLRYNSGWRAKAAGTFAFPDPTKAEHGGVAGVFNVRNIVELNVPLVSANGKNFARVTFDADVQLITAVDDPHGLKVTGGDPSGHGLIVSRGITGFLDATPLDLPNIADAIALLDAYGATGGPLAAAIDVASTGIAMALTGVEVKSTRGDRPRTIAAALRGTPHLPRDGSWSLAQRPHDQTKPQPLDPTSPVPLVRFSGATKVWRIADASDVTNLAAPLQVFGFLQATGANSVFFEDPVIQNLGAAVNPLNFQQTPKLADVGKLLGSGGILPDIASLLDLGSFDGLKQAADGFALKKKITKNLDLGKRTLIPLGPIRLEMASWIDPDQNPPPVNTSLVTVTLDATAVPPAPRWSISITNVAFRLCVDGWGGDDSPVIIVHGDASAQDGSAPTFSNLDVKYGKTLDVVKSILTEIEKFLPFLPGGSNAGLNVSFAGSKLRIREALPIPKLPLGVGFLEDIALDLGFDIDVLNKNLSFFVGLGDDLHPFHWLVSPLSGTGMLQLGSTDRLGIKMQAGIGVGLALDFAIVSGSASIVIAVQLDATSSPIGVMVLLTGQASVDVLDGLASASLTLTAGVGVKVIPGRPELLLPPPDPIEFLKETTVIFSAEVAVGIHISICWVVHVDFDGAWGFSETISGRTLAALV